MRKGRKITAIILTAAAVAAGALRFALPSQAVFDESSAVRYSEFAASHEIEDSTLFIGTYLLHTQSLTDELYEKALDSASESGQSGVYYKSELADGVWFDISGASGLAEISTSGKIVEESELADLWVTSWTDSTGVTRDARSGEAVSAFDTPDPYDLYHLPELEPLRLQYDNLSSSENAEPEGVDKYYYEILKEFFELDVRNEVTAQCDTQMEGLNSCYETLQTGSEKELAQVVSTLTGRIDSRRRAEVFYRLSQTEDNELGKLQEKASGEGYTKSEEYDDEQFVENANIIDAVGSAMENCQESYIEHSGKMLEEGTTVLKNTEYEKSMDVIDRSSGGWSESMRPALEELQHIYHIQDDVVADADGELALLNGTLLPRAEEKYTGSISSGAGGLYQAAEAEGRSEAVRRQMLEDQKTETDGVRSELQYLVKAGTSRMDSQAGVDDAYARIDKAEGWKSQIAGDAYHDKALESVDAYIIWLQDLARSIVSGDADMSSEMDELEKRKDELQGLKNDALADNDLAGAKRYDAMISLVDQQIADKEAELSAVLNNPNSSAADKARAANAAGNSTVLNNINEIKKSALASLADGNEEIGSSLDALAALGAEDALKEIQDSAAGSGGGTGAGGAGAAGDGSDGSGGAGSALDKALEDALAKSRESSLHGALDNAGADRGALEDLIEERLGGAFDTLGGPDKAAVAAALDRLGEGGNQAARELAQEYLRQCIEENNRYVYKKLEGQAGEYAPLDVTAYSTGYRYVYSDSRREATLTKRGAVYRFTVSGREVALKDQSTEQLSAKVEMQQTPYAAEQDIKKYFSCDAEYIEDSDYGVCLNPSMQKTVESILSPEEEGVEEDG